MNILIGGPEFEQMVADYVLEQFPRLRALGRLKPFRAVAFVDDKNVLHGGVVMTDYRGFDAQLSIYVDTPRFIGLQALRHLFFWAFDTQSLRRLTCLVDPANRKSVRFVEKLGFRYEGTMRLGLDGVNDAAIYGMTRDDCLWILK